MKFRKDFPLLQTKINGEQIVYFDNSATTQKPKIVLNAIIDFYKSKNSNVHRGINPLADIATSEYEGARDIVRKFLNAKSSKEIIFTSGATEGLNLLASTLGTSILKRGDVVVLSEAEHHANIVPWLMLKKKIGISIVYIPIMKNYRLDIRKAKVILKNGKVKVLSIQHASNVTGTLNNLKDLIAICDANKIVSVVDAAGSVAHTKVNVKELGCDFLVFSGHKVFGPTGIGVVYGKQKILEELPAGKGGGDMIREVKYDDFSVNELPYKFEAGTPNIVGAIGLGAALGYLNGVTWKVIKNQENKLTKYFLNKINSLKFITLIGVSERKERLPIFALIVDGVHPHDIADILGGVGIITRAGHHCVQPLHDKLCIPATLRVSLSFYNTEKEIDKLIIQIIKVHKMFN